MSGRSKAWDDLGGNSTAQVIRLDDKRNRRPRYHDPAKVDEPRPPATDEGRRIIRAIRAMLRGQAAPDVS